MDRVVVDTNIILDYLSASRPNHFEAVDFFSAVLDEGDIVPVVLAGSLKTSTTSCAVPIRTLRWSNNGWTTLGRS